jgi:hypothetical protein
MDQRVRYDWYRRWMEQPQRMQPGTRMPSVFTAGRSALEKVLDGSADAQSEALWAYFALGPTLPLPDGMELPRGRVLAVKERPVLVRTFLPEEGRQQLTKAVAVGYPGDVALAFDAATGRLAYTWSGNFLDVAPVWDGRGGAPAKVLGTRFWQSPPGCPWGLSDDGNPPDFGARATDLAYGATPPEGKLYDGPLQIVFAGYSTDGAGLPTFRYQTEAATDHPLEVRERPEPLRATAGVGVARTFTLLIPAQRTAWLRAGEGKGAPRLHDSKGAALPLDLAGGETELAAADQLLVLPQDGNKVLVLHLIAAPAGSRWRLQQGKDGRWQALLRLSPRKEKGEAVVTLRVWAPYRDEPALFRELIPK